MYYGDVFYQHIILPESHNHMKLAKLCKLCSFHINCLYHNCFKVLLVILCRAYLSISLFGIEMCRYHFLNFDTIFAKYRDINVDI